jgi:predicted ATPase
MAVSFDRPVLCPILVGRASYLDLFKQRIDEVQSGRGQIILLAGEAGIGKSRLVTEARTWADQNSIRILQVN